MYITLVKNVKDIRKHDYNNQCVRLVPPLNFIHHVSLLTSLNFASIKARNTRQINLLNDVQVPVNISTS
jgi:hypothetical protein